MILADIYLPALHRQYEFKLNERVPVADLTEEIGRLLLTGEGGGADEKIKEMILCSYDQSRILPPGETLSEAGIENGSRLLLL